MILLSAMKEMADNDRDNPDPTKHGSQRERDRDQSRKTGRKIINKRDKRRSAYRHTQNFHKRIQGGRDNPAALLRKE